MSEQHAFGLRVLLDQSLDDQSDVEARPLPRDVDHLVAVNLLAEPLLINRGSDGDNRIRVQVVYVFIGDEACAAAYQSNRRAGSD